MSYKYPTIKAVAAALRKVRDNLRADDDNEGWTEVRLQVYPVNEYGEMRWAVRSGSRDYDSDHLGKWGAGGLCYDSSIVTLRSIAKELIEQTRD